MSVITYVIGGAAFIATAVAGGYAVKGAIDITDHSGYHSDSELQKAHTFLTIASIVCWISVALILAYILYLAFSKPERTIASMGKRKTHIWLVIFILLLCLTIGILAIIAAVSIHGSKNYSGQGKDKDAYISAIISASLGVGTFGLIVIMAIIIWVNRNKKEKEAAKSS